MNIEQTDFAAIELQHAWVAARELNEAHAAGDDETALLAGEVLQGIAMHSEC